MFRQHEKIDLLMMLYWSLPRWNTRVAKEVKAGLTPVQILVRGLAMLHDSMPSLTKSLEPSRKKRCAVVADWARSGVAASPHIQILHPLHLRVTYSFFITCEHYITLNLYEAFQSLVLWPSIILRSSPDHANFSIDNHHHWAYTVQRSKVVVSSSDKNFLPIYKQGCRLFSDVKAPMCRQCVSWLWLFNLRLWGSTKGRWGAFYNIMITRLITWVEQAGKHSH